MLSAPPSLNVGLNFASCAQLEIIEIARDLISGLGIVASLNRVETIQ